MIKWTPTSYLRRLSAHLPLSLSSAMVKQLSQQSLHRYLFLLFDRGNFITQGNYIFNTEVRNNSLH